VKGGDVDCGSGRVAGHCVGSRCGVLALSSLSASSSAASSASALSLVSLAGGLLCHGASPCGCWLSAFEVNALRWCCGGQWMWSRRCCVCWGWRGVISIVGSIVIVGIVWKAVSQIRPARMLAFSASKLMHCGGVVVGSGCGVRGVAFVGAGGGSLALSAVSSLLASSGRLCLESGQPGCWLSVHQNQCIVAVQ